MGMRSHTVDASAHGTLHKYTRGWVDVAAIALIKSCVYPLFDCMDWEEKTHKPKNRNETSSARLLQTRCPEYKFPMQVFVFIHQYSLCGWMYHWSVAIDPVLNLIVIFLFSSEPGEGKKEGWPNVMVTTCSIVKGNFIDQDRHRGREGEEFQRDPNRLTF